MLHTVRDTLRAYKSALLSVFGFPLISDKNNPTRAIQADNSPGNCWAFEGEMGHLTIKLGQPIFVSHEIGRAHV